MVLCVCRRASDRDIAKAIEAGAASLPDLQRRGIADQCGLCHDAMKAILANARGESCDPCAGCACMELEAASA
jgi:bacterioferritin-associated ferredoxin